LLFLVFYKNIIQNNSCTIQNSTSINRTSYEKVRASLEKVSASLEKVRASFEIIGKSTGIIEKSLLFLIKFLFFAKKNKKNVFLLYIKKKVYLCTQLPFPLSYGKDSHSAVVAFLYKKWIE
jgi:hypothetical protein